jgi:dynein intermediate chain 1
MPGLKFKTCLPCAQYWEDPADQIREREGTLLPLWTFQAAATARGRHVTALAWCPRHADLFAAGYGSFDSQRQGAGAVVCFSLKSPATPEFQLATRSGVRRCPSSGQH